ncbi:MAG: FAD-dependent oxidoreductase [Raoultibacter sp.]|jgi:succinate dehydrogenase/fumarate reductase flavoprotein subunit
MGEIARRDFLKGAAVSAAGVVAAGSLVACSSGSGSSSSSSSSGSSGGLNSLDQKWSFEVAPDPIPESDITETIEADVIVVGGGISGLVSAMSCLENGLDVVLISASKAAVSRGGSNNAVYSSVMQELGLPRQDPEWFYRKEYVANAGNYKPGFWYKFYNNSEEAMSWVIEKATAAGIKTTIESGPKYEYPDPMWTPPAAHSFYVDDSELEAEVGTGQPHIAKEFARLVAEDLGGKIYWETKGEQLEQDSSGRVVAVIASDTDGAYKKYAGSKAVILATGDFSHDEEMMTKFCPAAVKLCDFTTEINYDQGLWMGGLMPGDGQKMGLWVGAAWQRSETNVMMLGRPNLPCDQPYTSHTGLMVDNTGSRFMNEDVLGGLACATIMECPEGVAYPIWGTNRAAAGMPWGKPNAVYGTDFASAEEFIETWDTDAYGFGVIKNDTLEGLIADLGLPASTIDTVKRYNELCASGKDTDFYKSASKMIPVTDGPFYGCEFKPGFLTSLGGLRTNLGLQVCNDADEPIPGLFNVGSMIGDLYSGTYTFAMEGINYGMACITLPYVLGKELGSGKFD